MLKPADDAATQDAKTVGLRYEASSRRDRARRGFSARYVGGVIAGLVAALIAIGAGVAGLIDAGLLNRSVAAWASAISGRSIRFRALHTHLLSRTPSFELDDLQVANPPGFPHGNLATVRRLVGTARLARLLSGSIGIDSLQLDGVTLSLIRYGPNRNNWTPARHRQGGPAFAALAGVERFNVSHGRLRFQDVARDLDISGPFFIDQDARPFHFAGAGTYLGAPIFARMDGAPLHGRAVSGPYPFAGRLIDGQTQIAVSGASAQPFDLSAYRLAVTARGPNLADIGYLFHLVTPNTPPFHLAAVVNSGQGFMRVGRIDVESGSSRVTGKIWSNHNDPRRDIRAQLRASRLDRAEIDAMLASVPSRLAARDRSGAVPAGPASHFIISPAPLGLARLRATDLDFHVQIGNLTGYALPIHGIVTRVDLDHGLLNIPSFHAGLFGGTVAGRLEINARSAMPSVQGALHVDGLRLAQIRAAAGGGTLGGDLTLVGSGPSFHDAAAHASGSGSLRISSALAPKAASWMIGGDLLRAAGSSLGSAKSKSPVTISIPDLHGVNGHFLATAVTVQSAAGLATGRASIDFGSETFCAYLVGHPDRHRLLQVSAPVRIEGPWLSPHVTIMPGRKARALGLHGKAGLVLTPLAGLLPIKGAPPPPACT